MLRLAKRLLMRVAAHPGVSSLMLSSRWRRNRLLILCYHGVSLDDEHGWSPALYVTPEHLRSRLSQLRDLRCTVLPLAEAIERLNAGTLPERAVVLTFDDGFYDFYASAWPILKSFGWPVTLYLTTYYTEHAWPVFDPMCDYLLWKTPQQTLDWPEVVGAPVTLDAEGRAAVSATIKRYTVDQGLSGQQKQDLLLELARRVAIDPEPLLRRRILQLMNPDEVRRVAAEGVDIQLHTHRHRVFRRRERLLQELDENRQRIRMVTDREATHFCYPGGFSLPEFPGWLREYGVLSATTCDPGLASRNSNRWLLPRVLDTETLAADEFAAWVSGIRSFMPMRTYTPSATQLGEERAPAR